MGRVRALIAAAVFGIVAPGCIHIHLDGDKDKLPPETQGQPGAVPQTKAKADSPIKQVAAFLPTGPLVPASLPKMLGKTEGTKIQAAEMVAVWQNRVAYLADPTPGRNGAFRPGLVGQLFLFAPGGRLAVPEGPLTIELYDETPRAGRTESIKLGQWTFDKDTLGKLKIHDERFGPCYALFLPWPDYRADILRVRLTAKYEPEGGFPIYALPSNVTFDTSVPGSPSAPVVTTTVVPMGPGGPMPGAPMSPIGGPPPANFPAAGMVPMSGSFPAGGPGAGAMPAGGFVPPMGAAQPTAGGFVLSPAGTQPTAAVGGPVAPMAPAAPAAPSAPQFPP
ncbi:MAG TPA: hypothetical protein VKE74_16675, partial [Gemmataceae bacterium]|nr:hypothetical protein [Gemmataceae bacterium]